MKKIMYGVTAVSAAVFILLSFFIYIVEADDIVLTKTAFHITSYGNKTSDRLVSELNKACKASDTDILVRVYRRNNNAGYDESVGDNIIYKTSNHTDFLKWHTQTGDCTVPAGAVFTNDPGFASDRYQPVKLYMPHIMGDYFIYSLTDMPEEDLPSAIFYTDAEYYDKLTEELGKCGIIIEKDGGVILDSHYGILLLGVTLVLFGLSFLSMLFWQLSESKKIAMKRLEGFSCPQIAFDQMIVFLKGFFPICVIALVIGCIAGSIAESFSLFLCFLEDYRWKLTGFILAWLFAMIISCFYTVFVHPLYAIRGRKTQKGLYGLTFFAKVCLVAVIGVVAYASFDGLRTIRATITVQNQVSETYSDYYYFLSNKSTTLVPDEELEKTYHDLYMTLSKTYKPVLMDPTNAALLSTMPEDKLKEYDSRIRNFRIINNNITVNRNYLDLNPVYTSDKEPVLPGDFPKNKLVLLIPDDTDEAMVRSSYKNVAESKGYSGESICIIKYDPSQKFYCFSADTESENPGYVEKPVVIVEQDFLQPSAWFSRGFLVFEAKSDDFYHEVLPVMDECGITQYIAGTVSLSGEIQYALNRDKTMFCVCAAALGSCIILLCCVLLYECVVYYKNNQKKITVKKMNGFAFWHIHSTHLIFRCVSYFLIAIYFALVGCPLWFSPVIVSLDFFCFCFVLESKTAKYAATVLKGDLS